MSAAVIWSDMVAGAAPNLTNLAGGKCPLGDAGNVEHPCSTSGRGKAFAEILQRHRLAQDETNDFLERTVAKPLSQGLAAMALKQPFDPVVYLVQWLRRYADEEERKETLAVETAERVKARAEIKIRRKDELRAEVTTYDSEGLTKEDRALLDTLENTRWLSEKVFQRILDYIKCALSVKAAYMMQLCGEGSATDSLLQYVGADSESRFLVDLTLNRDEGVVWDALLETAEPETPLSESNTDSDSDEETLDGKEDKNSEKEKKRAEHKDILPQGDETKGRVGKPLVVTDVMADERVKFWKMVRPGSLVAVSLIYEDPANRANVDAMREYLIELQSRARTTEEQESARRAAASSERKKSPSSRSSLSSGLQSKRTTLANGEGIDGESSDGEGDYERRRSEKDDDKDGLPPSVAPPTFTHTTVKMVFCVDTLGMDERVSPRTVTRLSKFVETIKKHCIRTRLAAVTAQAENSMDDEEKKQRAYEIEKGLEKVQVEAAPDIDAEKSLALERLETKLQEEKEKRDQRRQAHADDRKGRQFVGRQQQQTDAEAPRSGMDKSGMGEFTDDRATGDEERPTTNRQGWKRHEDDETPSGKAETNSAEGDNISEQDREEQDEDDVMEMLDPTFFLDEAAAKVKYEKTCEFVCKQYGSLLIEMENMFIPLTASAKPILAACLLLLGEPPSTLRMNSKVPETDWDWHKLRSRLGTSFVQRLSSYNPAVPRRPPPSSAPPATKDAVPLSQIAQIVEEVTALPEEAAPLIETSPGLFLLERWVKTAIDYRRKYLLVKAATLLRDARRNESQPPQLETEVDMDFQDFPLPPVLLSVDA